MNRRNVWAALLLVPLSVSLSQAQTKQASTPEEAVKYLVEGCKAGNVDAVFAQFASPMRAFIKMAEDERKIRLKLDAALDEAFGKDPKAKPEPELKDQIKSLTAMEVLEKTEKGKFVILKVKSTTERDGEKRMRDEQMIALKEGTAWKLLPPMGAKIPDDPLKEIEEQMKKSKDQMAKSQAAVDLTIKEIKEKKYKTRDEARTAYFNKLFPPPPPPPPPPPVEKK